jgi:catechol 2,3-dioxygenase-like lactoylglutathione lyase family enzyme
MSDDDVSSESTSGTHGKLGVDMNLEVLSLPVSDIDRAKAFYESLGWRMDIDFVISDDARTVQLTPPHSGCSIQFGKGRTTAEPGSAQGMILVVEDIDAARDDLIDRGVEVSEVQEASFSDPDGNTWELQEITTRLPGREWEN